MREDIRTLQEVLLATEMACVPSGSRSTSEEVYSTVAETYPDICDDSFRCDDVCSSGADQPEWKHAVRRVQQQLGRREHSRVQSHDEYDTWYYEYPALYLVPVSEDWLDEFHTTVERPVDATYDDTVPESIRSALPARIWGTTTGPQKRSYFERMSPKDWVLFYHDTAFFAGGVVGRTLTDGAVGEWLWNNPDSEYIYTIQELRDAAPSISRVWADLGYAGDPRVNGFMRVKDERVDGLREKYGSLEAALYGQVDTSTVPDGSESGSPDILAELERDDVARSTTVRDRILRDRATVESLKQRYDYECQVCGRQLRDGPASGYAEVHHIKPLGSHHGGPDVEGNMLVLCPNHHANFDHGMIAVDTATGRLYHAYDDELTGRRLTVHDSHSLRWDLVVYHNDEIAIETATSALP